jgi:LmbE family N-acetylglucosaminyl deacetylase
MEPWQAWKVPQRILVVLAHPDDPEFFCGATLARWTDAGHEVVYWLLTCGDKGAQDPHLDPAQLCGDRRIEQKNAAAVLGVREVHFCEYPDGYLEPTLEVRKEVTRIIRTVRPDVLVTCDPKTLYVGDARINHPDHRAAGQVVLDAAFPAAGNPMYFPDLLHQHGLAPHTPREIWISLTLDPNERHDVTDLWERKIRAIQQHVSQIGDSNTLAERMRARHTTDSTPEAPRYEEVFRRIVFI